MVSFLSNQTSHGMSCVLGSVFISPPKVGALSEEVLVLLPALYPFRLVERQTEIYLPEIRMRE